MKKTGDKDPIDVLGRIYETIYEDSVSAFNKSEKKTSEVLHLLIDEAGALISKAEKVSREQIDEAGEVISVTEEVSREQIDEVSDYVKRDINDLALYLSKTGKELSDWLGFELELLEDQVVEQLFKAVDPSTISLLKLKEQESIFHTGQVTGPGVLQCNACGEELHYYKAGRIPPCPKCSQTEFHRENA